MHWWFLFASLSSAFALFLVQPMLGKQVLPAFGGAPAVWTVCLLFFQTGLLLGYLYAHWLRRRTLAQGVAVHGAVLIGAALLPPTSAPAVPVPGDLAPMVELLGYLVCSAALPFSAIAASAPLLQRWFAATTARRAHDPYFLYAASNLGSLAALAGYPTLIEPFVPLSDQLRFWGLGIAVLALLTGVCGVLAVRSSRRRPTTAAESAASTVAEGARAEPLTMRRRLHWLLLAFTPSTLLAGVTAFLTSDVAPVPLLWVVPLGLYLLSFVIAFGRTGWEGRRLVGALPWLFLPLTVQMTALAVWWTGLFHLAAFLAVALACHGALAADRPNVTELTEYYLWLALGGALGGLSNALVAPLLFDSLAEYPLALLLALLLTSAVAARRRARGLPWERAGERFWLMGTGELATASLVVISAGVCRLLAPEAPLAESLARLLLCSLPAMIGLALIGRPYWPALVIGLALVAMLRDTNEKRHTLHRARSFFGIHRVVADERTALHRLLHGGTIHGSQSSEPQRRCQPLAYAAASGPVGQIFAARTGRHGPVAVVGLGTGAMICYRQPGEHFDFFEVDTAVVRIAENPRLFTYLSECGGGGYAIHVGDGRQLLARETSPRYRMIFLDAFSSDAVPVHLLTRQALAVYLSRLADDGWLVFNVTNRFLDLERVVAALAREEGLAALAKRDTEITDEERRRGKMASHYVVLARREDLLFRLQQFPGWYRVPAAPVTAWTDEHTSLLSIWKW